MSNVEIHWPLAALVTVLLLLPHFLLLRAPQPSFERFLRRYGLSLALRLAIVGGGALLMGAFLELAAGILAATFIEVAWLWARARGEAI